VKIRVFGCRRFHKLMNDGYDRELGDGEERFMARHRHVCSPCRSVESQSNLALNMLRASALEPEPMPAYEDRLLRRLRLQHVRASFNYWSPAFFGAAIAGVAILAALQMITQSSKLPLVPLKGSGNEARRINVDGPQFPEFSFHNNPSAPQ
jgi:hypothetical protein